MNRRVEEKLVLRPKIKRIIKKLMISIILLLLGLIISKENPNAKEYLKKNVYEKSINFTKNQKIYKKYFGKVFNKEEVIEQPVFSEKINFLNEEEYNNGVKLTVENNYQVPVLESGVIIYIGEKEGYGKTIIVEQVNEIEVSYSNVEIKNYKMYDYIEKGDILGNTIDNKLIITFQKEGKYLDYKKYI
jgi:stage IV sporulation protein FA